MKRIPFALISLHLWLVLLCAAARAEDVGTVASVRGAADIGRAGAWTPAAVGMVVALGDELRTGDGQLRVVFRDDSVVDLSENSSLVVDRQVFDPDGGRFSSLIKLVQGKARALVGSYYGTPGASYEVETPTAVAGVRGTSFMVAYDPASEATEVVGIRGRIEVRGIGERAREVVYVTAQEATTVMRGAGPTQPEPIEQRMFQRDIEGLELLSLGNVNTGLAASHPVGAGSEVPAPDKAPPSSSGGLAGQVGRDELRNAGDVVGQPLGVGDATRGQLVVP
jgi:hypothetical protein